MKYRKTVTTTWVLAIITFAVALGLGIAHSHARADDTGAPATAEPASIAAAQAIHAPALAPATSTESRELLQAFGDAFHHAAEAVNPSVVPILSEEKVSMNGFAGMGPFGDEFFRHFFGGPQMAPEGEQIRRGLGSGVIVSRDGYILTNNHVVQDSDKLVVIIGDNRRVPAKIVGTDPESDLAVIKIDEDNLPAATLGDSDSIEVGQWVIAVGNPLQLLHSVTAGIISATGRSSVGLANYEDFIQTDASINPGNSGGALANLDGAVIGINTAIASPSGGNVGVGFAIPINMARRIMDDLIQNGRITRGYVGLYLQDLNEDLAKGLGIEETQGVLVSDVVKDGPADHAKVQTGDVIVACDGKEIHDGASLRNTIAAGRPGTVVRLEVLRNGRRIDVPVTLAERPAEQQQIESAGGNGEAAPSSLGLTVRDLTPDLAHQLKLDDAHGVLIASVEPGSAADEAGLRPRDLIERAGDQTIDSVQALRSAVEGVRSGEVLVLLVRRGGASVFVAVHVP